MCLRRIVKRCHATCNASYPNKYSSLVDVCIFRYIYIYIYKYIYILATTRAYILACTIFMHVMCIHVSWHYFHMLPVLHETGTHLMCVVLHAKELEHVMVAGLRFKPITFQHRESLLVPWRPQRCPRVLPTVVLVATNGKRCAERSVILHLRTISSRRLTSTCLAQEPVQRYTR